MKLLTNIPPRRDGTVTLAHEGKTYVFKADESGDLVADVDDDTLVAKCLAAGTFEPADEQDFETAEALLQAAKAAEKKAAAEDEDGEDDDDDAPDPDALPVEANTPPVSAPKPGSAKAARKRAAS